MVSGLCCLFSAPADASLRSHSPFRNWCGDLGHKHSRRMGLRDCEFRVVDRYRACRYVDFRDPTAAAPKVAHVDQPYRRSNDHIRSALRGYVSRAPPGTSVARLLAVPLSEYDVVLAAISQPLGVGRIRRFVLFYRFALVLVRWTHPGFGHIARPGPHSTETGHLRISGHGLARLRRALEALRNHHAASRRA